MVAAVCHRRYEGAVQFLLVQTKGGKRWTFPKGHVEPGELPSAAAVREAREEAGAEGDVEPAPFTRYRYPATRDAEGETGVAAYLLAVARQGPPAPSERRRDPTWVAPAEAVRLLARGREHDYAEEHARVVSEAVTILSQQP